jgi:hypothetical protein
VVSGDFLLAIIGIGTSDSTLAEVSASGWSLIAQMNELGITVSVCWKVSNGADTAPHFTWTNSAAASAFVARFNGTSATGLGTHGAMTSGSNTGTHTSVSFNSTADNSLAVAVDVQNSATVQGTTPTGWTLASATADATAAKSIAIWTKQLSASGSASGAISVTEDAVRYGEMQIELLVAVAAAAPGIITTPVFWFG